MVGLVLSVSGAGAATVVDLAHALPDDDRLWLESVVERFNRSQSEVSIHLLAGGGTTAATLALVDGGGLTAVGGEKAFRPLFQVMAESGRRLDRLTPEALLSVGDAQGRPLALPIALSTPLLFYNKAAFRAVGLDPDRPPATWYEVQHAADKLIDAGSQCPFTVTRSSRTLIEQTSLLHGEPVFGSGRQATFNGQLQVKHLAMMSSWYKSRFLKVFGREDEAVRHFAAGECGMIADESRRVPAYLAAGIELGVTRFPIHEGYYGAPKHTVVDGSALWVGRGRSKAEYRAATRFISFLQTQETQTELIRNGGFLPYTGSAKAIVESRTMGLEFVPQRIALEQIRGARRGAQLPRMPLIRQILDEEIESVWADRKPAKEALDSAVERSAIVRGAGTSLH